MEEEELRPSVTSKITNAPVWEYCWKQELYIEKKMYHKQNELKVYKVEVLTGSLLCCTKQIVNKDSSMCTQLFAVVAHQGAACSDNYRCSLVVIYSTGSQTMGRAPLKCHRINLRGREMINQERFCCNFWEFSVIICVCVYVKYHNLHLFKQLQHNKFPPRVIYCHVNYFVSL